MADSNRPRMPLAASSNMMMSMSINSPTPHKLSNTTTVSSTPEQDVMVETDMEPHTSVSRESRYAGKPSQTSASMGGRLVVDVQRDRIGSREETLGMQRLQLAAQLKDKHRLCEDLEARITSIQDEIARLTSSNKRFEIENEILHGELDEAVKKLESQVIDAGQRDKGMLERVSDLETKLNKAIKDLEQTMLSRDTLQRSYDELVKTCSQQSDKTQQLEHKLEIGRTKLRDLTIKYDELTRKYNKDVTLAISSLEKSHESRQRDLQKRLTLKGTEAKELKREIRTLQTACAEAVTKKEAVQAKLHTKVTDHRVQTLQEKRELAEARDRSLAEPQKLRQSLDELEKSVKPFAQTVVICVDVSGSTSGVIEQIKQAYREVLLMVNSTNSRARVGVVIHGAPGRQIPLPAQAISDATFRIIDTLDSMGGSEDYTYCLKHAQSLFGMDDDSQKVIILIGDGAAMCSNTNLVFEICDQLKSAHILAHSIVFSSGWLRSSFSSNLTMRDISSAIGGRVEDENTYSTALDEIFRHERERHFGASHL